MSFVLSGKLIMDAAQAKAEVDATKRAVDFLRQSTGAQTQQTRTSTGATNTDTAAKQRNRQATDQMATANRQAAGATGNLVAQFNDIGMMLAAGQNPLQLAIQQGTQITQVIGPMGAAGAAQALGGAFVRMLSPINLVTLGFSAAGAAAIQWLTSAAANAVTLEQRIEAVNDAVSRWRDESGQSLDDLRDRFGAITPEIVAMQREMTQLRIAEIMQEADAAARQLADTMGQGALATAGGDLRRLFLESGIVLGTSQMREFKAALDAVGTATGIGEQLAAVEALRERFAQITGGIGAMSEGQRAFYATLLDTEDALRAAAVATGEVANETDVAAAAAAELATRAQAIVAAISSADGSRLVAAFQAAFPVASQLLGMAQGIIDTIGQARAAAAAQDQLDQMAIEFSPGGRALTAYGGRTPGGTSQQNALASRNRPAPAAEGGGRSGAGAAAARDEADALQELIRSLEAEIEALRVQDPIQEEMLKHREALAGATEAERQKVEELIATREREMVVTESLQFVGQSAGNALIDALMGADDAGKQLIQTLIRAALQATILGEGPLGGLFGNKSIFSGLFGGAGGGGLAGLFGGGKAEGGMIYGPGTATSDSIPTLLSNGEYVVNARATARNRHLLEAINAGGRIPAYATGGYVGSDNRRMAGRSGSDLPASIYIDLRGSNGDQAIEERVRKGAAEVVKMYDQQGLPVSIQRVSADPKRRN